MAWNILEVVGDDVPGVAQRNKSLHIFGVENFWFHRGDELAHPVIKHPAIFSGGIVVAGSFLPVAAVALVGFKAKSFAGHAEIVAGKSACHNIKSLWSGGIAGLNFFDNVDNASAVEDSFNRALVSKESVPRAHGLGRHVAGEVCLKWKFFQLHKTILSRRCDLLPLRGGEGGFVNREAAFESKVHSSASGKKRGECEWFV